MFSLFIQWLFRSRPSNNKHKYTLELERTVWAPVLLHWWPEVSFKLRPVLTVKLTQRCLYLMKFFIAPEITVILLNTNFKDFAIHSVTFCIEMASFRLSYDCKHQIKYIFPSNLWHVISFMWFVCLLSDLSVVYIMGFDCSLTVIPIAYWMQFCFLSHYYHSFQWNCFWDSGLKWKKSHLLKTILSLSMAFQSTGKNTIKEIALPFLVIKFN